MVRLEEIDELNACFENVKRLKIVAADGATNYMRECVDAMDDANFDIVGIREKMEDTYVGAAKNESARYKRTVGICHCIAKG